MKTLFKSQELCDLVEKDYTEEDEAQRIAVAETSKQAWDILKKEFHGSTKVMTVKIKSLQLDFKNSSMKSSEFVQGYLSRANAIVNHMKAYGDKITE
ncbi:hypothetical protein KY285_012546 [Solanum tuberosum]|nr:hypothetical protein KY289_011253 [Solanum tuberosum]KAH0736839.1 hypothetical protein KY285_012546 [Solanum tuberosum]